MPRSCARRTAAVASASGTGAYSPPIAAPPNASVVTSTGEFPSLRRSIATSSPRPASFQACGVPSLLLCLARRDPADDQGDEDDRAVERADPLRRDPGQREHVL